MITADLLLQHLAGTPHRRATLKQLLRELKVRGGQRQALRSLLSELVRTHRLIERHHAFELVANPKPVLHAPGPGKPAVGDLTGRISLHRDGYGFVSPDPPRKDVPGDVFIPPPAIGGAMHGDTVAVRIVRKRQSPTGETRIEGAVVAIARRAQATLVGTFHYDPRGSFVQPLDDRLRDRILIPQGAEVPDTTLTPHRVVGTQAATSAAHTPEELDGQVVDIELTTFPAAAITGRGHVLEVLGRRDDFGVDVEIIIRKHHLLHRFPPDVLAQAAAYNPEIPPAELAARRDFRALPIVTIDGESARDFDDAVLVETLPSGNFQLQVHIADVSYYVTPGSPIDREAQLRGTSVYFPDRAVPMLPTELSTNLCSLRPHEDRLVMSCLMELDPQGEVVNCELTPGVIRSAQRMTYTQVNAVLEGDAAAREQFAPLIEGFERMAALQAVLYAKRQRRGSIDFDLPEPEIAFDEFGLMRSIVKSERNIAHRLIEEFMLAAAESVARHLENAILHGRAPGEPTSGRRGGAAPDSLPRAAVYRIHEQPDLKKVAEFETVAATFGYSLGVGPLPIQKMRVRGRVVEVPQPGKFKISPRNYQRLAAKIAGTTEERMLSFLMLRSLKQARYSAQNVGHFALATACYTHFTSPIRRYPDLMVHRILKALLAGQAPPEELRDAAAIEPLCKSSSERERGADDAERELMDWKKVRFMEKRLGEEFAALIIHVTRQGFYLELDDLFIEGFVPATSLDDDDYHYLDASKEWVGERGKRRYKLGARIQVIVDRIDPVRQQIHFAPVVAKPPSRPRKSRASA